MAADYSYFTGKYNTNPTVGKSVDFQNITELLSSRGEYKDLWTALMGGQNIDWQARVFEKTLGEDQASTYDEYLGDPSGIVRGFQEGYGALPDIVGGKMKSISDVYNTNIATNMESMGKTGLFGGGDISNDLKESIANYEKGIGGVSDFYDKSIAGLTGSLGSQERDWQRSAFGVKDAIAANKETGGCVQSNCIVTTRDGEKKIIDVKVGDYLKVDESNYSEVLHIGHKDETKKETFCEIGTKKNTIRVTKRHMMFTNTTDKMAKDLVVGDHLENGDVITKIKIVKDTGFISPYTRDGKYLVNGFLVSNYSGAKHKIMHFVMYRLLWPLFIITRAIGCPISSKHFKLLNKLRDKIMGE